MLDVIRFTLTASIVPAWVAVKSHQGVAVRPCVLSAEPHLVPQEDSRPAVVLVVSSVGFRFLGGTPTGEPVSTARQDQMGMVNCES